MKYILNYWQPKDIPQVLEEFEKIKGVDKLIFKYQQYPEPHKNLEEFLKKHDYDYFIIFTNDVIVKQENIDMLIEDIERDDFKIISGVMNVDLDKNKDKWNICYDMPTPYNWVEKTEKRGIIQVKFAGFPLMAIHKSVYKDYNWYIHNYKNNAQDLRFCKYCDMNNIKINVNTRNEMKHLRFHGEFDWTKKSETVWLRNT